MPPSSSSNEHANTIGLVREMLLAEGYAVVEAGSGTDALELLIADIEQEGSDGSPSP